MRQQDGGGSIINASSTYGQMGFADAVMFLGSDKATYTTGQTLTLDGGLMAGWPLFPAA
jgi:hypothetical protein